MTSSGSQATDIAAQLRQYGKVCASISRDEADIAARLCEVGKAFLQAKARSLVASANGQPILVHFSSDGTPISTKKQVKGTSPAYSASRQGRDTEEYQVQHVFYRTLDSAGQPSTVALVRDPVPLTHGKSALAIYSSGKAFFQNARQLGHMGISICTYSWDRAAYGALSRVWRQHHMVLGASFSMPERGLDSEALSLLEWVEPIPCCQHDTHNALKWSLHSYFNDAQLMGDMYIIVASVRNAYVLLHQHLAHWLQAKLVLVPDHELPPVQERVDLWTALGVDPDLVELLACKLRLQWEGGKVEIAESCADLPDLLETLSTALLGLWQFQQFSASRWVTIGASCRNLVAAWLSGFDSLVAATRADPKASDFHIHGYTKLTPDLRKFVAIAAFSSYTSEAVLAELIADSRVARRVAELEDAMAQEVGFLTSLKQPVWEAIGNVCGMTPGELRSRVLSAAHVANGFLYTKCLTPAKQLPWSLGVGDVDENLSRLAGGPLPAQPTAQKIWQLLRIGYNNAQLKIGLALLLDAPWGTASVEQQHASATVVKKFHPEISQESLMERAFLHTFRLLLPSPDTEAQRVEAQRQRVIQLLFRRRPQAIGGRQVFVKDLIGLSEDWKRAGSKAVQGPAVQKTIMKGHGARWAKLPAHVRQQYEAKAQSERQLAMHSWEETVAVETGKLSLMTSRLEAERAQRPHCPLALSSGKLAPADFQELQAMMSSPAFTSKHVKRLREAARVAHPLPSHEDLQALRACLVEEEEPRARPDWVSTVCWNRAFFHNTAFAFVLGERREWYTFLYATQSPLFACFSRLEPEEHFVPMVALTGSNWNAVGASSFDHRFTVDFQQTTPWHELPDVPVDAIEVLTHLQYLGGHSVASPSEWEPLGPLLAKMPPKPASTRGARVERSPVPDGAEELLKAHPFLRGILGKQAEESSTPTKAGSASTGEGFDAEGSSPPGDDRLQELFAALEAKREEWLQDGQDHPGDFKVVLLGGEWLMKQAGQAYHAFRGQAKRDSPSFAFCRQYGLQTTAQFNLNFFGKNGLCHGTRMVPQSGVLLCHLGSKWRRPLHFHPW